MLARLMPKEGRFFECFNTMGQKILEGCTIFEKLLQDHEHLPDYASSTATIVSTRVLSPRHAVAWAAFFFAAFLIFGTHVATTIGIGIVHEDAAALTVILAGLVGASFRDMITWYPGLPTSSSHALIGGFCAETSGATTLFMVTMLGIPVSTTHTMYPSRRSNF